jgi:hypothetical protein
MESNVGCGLPDYSTSACASQFLHGSIGCFASEHVCTTTFESIGRAIIHVILKFMACKIRASQLMLHHVDVPTQSVPFPFHLIFGCLTLSGCCRGVTIEYQRAQAKELVAYFRSLKEEKVAKTSQ